MGTSVSRGNLDESGISRSAAASFNALSLDSNPQEVYTNFFDHGYVLMTFKPDSMTAAMYLCPILALSDSQNLETTLVCRTDENHWVHPPRISGVAEFSVKDRISIYPNPVTSWVHLNLPSAEPSITVVTDMQGRQLLNAGSAIDINTQSLAPGIYVIHATQNGKEYVIRFVKE